jgi:hypothetical protein
LRFADFCFDAFHDADQRRRIERPGDGATGETACNHHGFGRHGTIEDARDFRRRADRRHRIPFRRERRPRLMPPQLVCRPRRHPDRRHRHRNSALGSQTGEKALLPLELPAIMAGAQHGFG